MRDRNCPRSDQWLHFLRAALATKQDAFQVRVFAWLEACQVLSRFVDISYLRYDEMVGLACVTTI